MPVSKGPLDLKVPKALKVCRVLLEKLDRWVPLVNRVSKVKRAIKARWAHKDQLVLKASKAQSELTDSKESRAT
jgi:hypothetical protein